MAGLASLLSRRTMNPRAGGAARRRELLRRRGTPPPMWDAQGNPWPSGQSPGTRIGGPPGGKHGGQVKGWQLGGAVFDPRRTRGDLTGGGGRSVMPPSTGPHRNFARSPGGWQEGGPVGAAPEEVEMAAEIYAMATPEQQAQITGGGGPGMMDEEAAIGEALEMALGGGGGPPMGGPPMGGGGPPMGGMI